MGDDQAVINEALLAIHSRLGTIEGRVTLIARAEREHLLESLKKVIHADPLTGQIYLLLDGKRTQREILSDLGALGIATTEATVSRRLKAMTTEHGLADLVSASNVKIYRKNTETERVLNLSKRIEEWLSAANQPAPVRERRKRRSR